MKWKPNRHSHLTIQEQIVDWIKSRIERGDWTVGTKIPTQRQLAMEFNVNRSTVQLALDELKADGLLESKMGSGVFVANNSWNVLLDKAQPNWQQHIESSIHKPNYHTIQLINEYEQKDHIIRLGTGELSPELLPTKQIEQSLKAISLDSKAIGYSSPQGSEKLRGILCNYLKKRGIQTDAREHFNCFRCTSSTSINCNWIIRRRFYRLSRTTFVFKFCPSLSIRWNANDFSFTGCHI